MTRRAGARLRLAGRIGDGDYFTREVEPLLGRGIDPVDVDEEAVTAQSARASAASSSPPKCSDTAFSLLGHRWNEAFVWGFRAGSTPGSLNVDATERALKKAQARAQTYAKSLGLQMRRIVSISENSSGGFRPMQMMRTMAAGAAMDKATPVAPGESTVSVNLDVVFELGR